MSDKTAECRPLRNVSLVALNVGGACGAASAAIHATLNDWGLAVVISLALLSVGNAGIVIARMKGVVK